MTRSMVFKSNSYGFRVKVVVAQVAVRVYKSNGYGAMFGPAGSG
jgi:hypothetical protein